VAPRILRWLLDVWKKIFFCSTVVGQMVKNKSRRTMAVGVVPWIRFCEIDWGAEKNCKKILVRIDDGSAEVRTSVFRQLDVGTSFSTMTTDQLEMLANSWNALPTFLALPEIARPHHTTPMTVPTVFRIPASANIATYCSKCRDSGAISWLVCVDIHVYTNPPPPHTHTQWGI